jgi:hypothetical protein
MTRRRPAVRLTRRRVRALARAFDRATAPAGAAAEWRLKARLRRRRRGGSAFLTRAELAWIAEWKTPRIRPLIARNTEAGVRGVTAAAFLVADEARRVRVLTALPGVGLPVASVVLHFAWPERYPIYDVRVLAALRTLGLRERFPPTAPGWVRYAARLRALAATYRVALRTLDKALWRLGARAGGASVL